MRLIEFYNKESQGSGVPIDISVENIAQVKEEVGRVVKKIAEREALAHFMAIIDMTLERKECLLKTIEQYGQFFEIAVSTGDAAEPTSNVDGDCPISMEVPKFKTYIQFKEHLRWLRTNLKITEKSLQAALVQLQVLYGKGYTGFPIPSPLRSGEEVPKDSNSETLNAANAIDDLTIELGEILASQLCPASQESRDRLTNEYQSCMISSACSMLLTSDLFVEKIERWPMTIAKMIDSTFDSQLQNLRPEPISNLPQVAQEENWDLRIESFKKLTEAVAMLSDELVARN